MERHCKGMTTEKEWNTQCFTGNRMDWTLCCLRLSLVSAIFHKVKRKKS